MRPPHRDSLGHLCLPRQQPASILVEKAALDCSEMAIATKLDFLNGSGDSILSNRRETKHAQVVQSEEVEQFNS
jgi:hypothetical protein